MDDTAHHLVFGIFRVVRLQQAVDDLKTFRLDRVLRQGPTRVAAGIPHPLRTQLRQRPPGEHLHEQVIRPQRIGEDELGARQLRTQPIQLLRNILLHMVAIEEEVGYDHHAPGTARNQLTAAIGQRRLVELQRSRPHRRLQPQGQLFRYPVEQRQRLVRPAAMAEDDHAGAAVKYFRRVRRWHGGSPH